MVLNKIAFLPVWSLLVLAVAGCEPESPDTPRAAKHRKQISIHDQSWNDPYHYLNDPGHLDTQRFLADEKDYFLKTVAPMESLRRHLAIELNTELPDNKKSLPVVSGSFQVYSEIHRGSQYPVYYRRALDSADEPEVILDLNELAADSGYYAIGSFVTSPDEQLVAFTEDPRGDQQYRLRIRDIQSGLLLQDAIDGVAAGLSWSGAMVNYVCLAESSVYQHRPGSSRDNAVFVEQDPAFHVSLRQRRNGNETFITSESHDTTEIHLLGPGGVLQLIAARRQGHRYRVRLIDERLTILTNLRTPSFEIAFGQIADNPGSDDWVFPQFQIDGHLIDFEVFNDLLLVQSRHLLRDKLHVVDLETTVVKEVFEGEAGERIVLLTNPDQNSSSFHFSVTSLLHPDHRYRYDVSADQTLLISRESVSGNYRQKEYQIEELWFEARDGQQVPITLIYKKGFRLPKSPLYLFAYGAYGLVQPMKFETARLPLLNRGFVLGFVHVRGGGELGEHWHDQGRMQLKQNSFRDFIDATTFLTDNGYGHPDKVFARGASAGGTLIAVIANEAPQLYRGLIADVPFVDLINTLSSSASGRNASEYLEWGNPNAREDFEIIYQYSPYERIRAQQYPNILITAAANDARVGAFEALKWMAGLREHNTGPSVMLIDIEQYSGHLGASDQYLKRRKRSLEYAFILNSLGIKD